MSITYKTILDLKQKSEISNADLLMIGNEGTGELRQITWQNAIKNASVDLSDYATKEEINELSEEIIDVTNWIRWTNNLATGIERILGAFYKTVQSDDVNYSYLKEIPVKANVTYNTSRQARFIAFLDNNKENLSFIEYETEFTPSQDGYVNVTFNNSYWDGNIRIYESKYDLSEVCDYDKFFVQEDVKKDILKEVKITNNGDFLSGKKWYACGDSFTEGDFTGLTDETEYKFQDAPYLGKNKVYPFYIGRRTGIDVYNLAKGGSTICPTNRPGNYFSPSIYESIPEDADYITLAFGINDAHVGNEIGTIDDTTNATFYGAWNVVMDYLISNHPFAKIGIIVTNGLDSDDYAQAIINIAHKWGVPYLNLWSGEQVPLMNRSGRTDVKASVVALRSFYFRVSKSNSHPSAKAHEYESTFIETWLRTL